MHGLSVYKLTWDGGTGSTQNAKGCREGDSKCGMAISKRTGLLERQDSYRIWEVDGGQVKAD